MKRNNAMKLILCLLIVVSLLFIPVFATGETVPTVIAQEQIVDETVETPGSEDIAILDAPDDIKDASVANGCHSVDAKQPLLGNAQLVTNAKAVFLYETTSDTMMYAWEPDLSVEPASLAKIMTAYLAVEQGELDTAVTVSQAVLDTVPEDAVSSYLVADEVLSLEQLLYLMMIDSGNDAAAIIADHVGGSQGAFVDLMNQKAEELGCTATHFTNVHGLYDENQFTTARDMTKILAAAIENEAFAEIFQTVYYTVPATNKSEERKLATGNYMMCTDDMPLYFDERVTGGRTGVANDGTRCLAVTAKQNDMELISIVIGAEDSTQEDSISVHSFGGYAETATLLNNGFEGYYSAHILYEGQVLTQRTVLNGNANVSLGCASSLSTVLPQGISFDQLSLRYVNGDTELTAPVEKGENICDVEIWYGGLCVAYTELYTLNSVGVAEDLVVRKEGSIIAWWVILLIVIAVAIVIAAIVFFVRNKKNIQNFLRAWRRSRLRRKRRQGR